MCWMLFSEWGGGVCVCVCVCVCVRGGGGGVRAEGTANALWSDNLRPRPWENIGEIGENIVEIIQEISVVITNEFIFCYMCCEKVHLWLMQNLYLTIGKTVFRLFLFLAGVHFRGELQYGGGDVISKKSSVDQSELEK